MVIVIARSLIIFVLLILGMRLMGKRTIGELQPYEFVITLAVAELACTPMQDLSVPLIYGIIPLFTIFIAHYVITLITSKSIKFRKALNGKPLIVVDSDGINSECLKKLNMNVNDLMSLIRQQGYFSLEQVSYAIIETNGKLSVLENEEASSPNSIPMCLIVEGSYMNENLQCLNISHEQVDSILQQQNLEKKEIVIMTADSNRLFIQPKTKKFRIVEVK